MLAFLDELLAPASFSDYGPNGLQVPGHEDVQTVVTGVSASAELFRRAAALEADLVLVHHGIFWSGAPLALTPTAKRRLALLFEHDMALAAYHLPLDGHPEVGNNALIAAGLGCSAREPFALHKGTPIGVAGSFEGDGVDPGELVSRVRELTRPRAAGLPLRARARPLDRDRLRRGLGLPRRRRRGRPRRLPDRRADRARHDAGL